MGVHNISTIEKERPDVVLLDILLPDINGWQILSWIRSHSDQKLASTPIIMQTALGAQEQKIKGLVNGSDAYIPKPYSIREILLTTRRLSARNRKVSRLSTTICSQRKKLEIQQAVQDMVFHELQGVSGMIGGLSNLVRKKIGSGKGQEKDAENCLQGITSGARYLENMGRNLSVLTKIADGPDELPKKVSAIKGFLDSLLQRYRYHCLRYIRFLHSRGSGQTAQPQYRIFETA